MRKSYEMNAVLSLWRRFPIVLRAILIGLTIALAGTLPWPILIGMIQKSPHSPPWEVPVMALYLAVYWRYLNGWGWPKSTSAFRRESLRAKSLSADAWASAIAAGILAVGLVVALQFAYSQFVHLPVSKAPALSAYPWYTLLPALIMGGALAGIVEEAAFRGYMQSMIERRHGPLISIGVVSLVFAAAHLTHGVAHTLPRVPFYIAISVIYGLLTYRTGSILPALVIHAGGDVLEFLSVVTL